jgi:hypothetical protein
MAGARGLATRETADSAVNGFEAKRRADFRIQLGLETPPSLRPRSGEKSLNYFSCKRGGFFRNFLSIAVYMPP